MTRTSSRTKRQAKWIEGRFGNRIDEIMRLIEGLRHPTPSEKKYDYKQRLVGAI